MTLFIPLPLGTNSTTKAPNYLTTCLMVKSLPGWGVGKQKDFTGFSREPF